MVKESKLRLRRDGGEILIEAEKLVVELKCRLWFKV